MRFAPFEAPHLKVSRARRHINEVEAETERWAHAEGQDHKFQPAWPSVSLAIGDAIHNLRTALDHLACDVVRSNNRSSNGVYFPFSEDAATLDKQIKDKNFDRASAAAIQLLKKQEPWRGGKLALRAVHDLDVKDKHELIIPLISVRTKEIRKDGIIDLMDGTACFACGSPKDQIPRSTIGEPSIMGHIFFPDDLPLSRKEIIPTLTGLADTISGVIEAFELLIVSKDADA